YGTAVAADALGGIAVTGYFHDTVDFGGGPLASAGGQDVFVARLSAAGAHQSSRRAGGVGDDAARGIAFAPGGDAIITGNFQGSADFGGVALTAVGGGDQFVARYRANGTHVWSRRFGGAGFQYGAAVCV